jgi:hypothetical protein
MSTAVTTKTVALMVNDAMKALTKSEALTLANRNTAQNWKQQIFTVDQFASYISCGGTWRPGINNHGDKNVSETINRFNCIALDFDGLPLPGEAKPSGFSDGAMLTPSAAIAYRTLSWSKEKPYKERLVFIFDRQVNADEYKTIFKELRKVYPNSDPACGDNIRFFFGSNQPCLFYRDVTLEVDSILNSAPQEKPKEKRAATKSKKTSKHLTMAEIVYRDILSTKLDGDVEKLYCLWPHNFKERTPDAEDSILKLEGRNPFSATDSTGSSFVVTQLEGQLPIWHDRSMNLGSQNGFNGGNGGTIFEYWFKLHPDFKNSDVRFSMASVIISIYRHFEVMMPDDFLIEYYLDILRHRLPGKLRLNLLGNRVEYDGKPLPDEIITWFSNKTLITETRVQVLLQCVRTVARENAYHPFKEYLEKLGTKYTPNAQLWDDCATVLFGIPKSSPYHALYTAFWQKFLLSTLARVYYPGIKYDCSIIILGPQGCGKTETFRYAVPPQWHYTNGSFKLDRDTVLASWQAVLVGFDDVAGMQHKKEVEEVKAYLSSSSAIVREPYATTSIEIPRSWNVYMTSNASKATGVLGDVTGHRRFNIIDTEYCLAGDIKVPIPVKYQIFGQLWLSALEHFKQLPQEDLHQLSSALNIEPEMWALNHEHNEQYLARGVLLEAVDHALQTKLGPGEDTITMLQLCQMVAPGTNISSREQGNIAQHLHNLGWRRVDMWGKVNGRTTKKRVWKRPEEQEDKAQKVLGYQKVDIDSYLLPLKESAPAPAPAPKPAAPTPAPKPAAPTPAPKPAAPTPAPKPPAPTPAPAPSPEDAEWEKQVQLEQKRLREEFESGVTPTTELEPEEEDYFEAPDPEKVKAIVERVRARMVLINKAVKPENP